MKRIVYLLITIVLLVACNERKNKIEVIEDYDQIYLSADKVEKPARPLNEDKEFINDLKMILKELHGDEKNKMIYPISYKVYINKEGEIEKIMDDNHSLISYLIRNIDNKEYLPNEIIDNESILKDIERENIYRNIDRSTIMLLPFFERFKFIPAELDGKPVPFRTKVQTFGVVDKNGVATFEISFLNGSPMSANFSSPNNDEYFVMVDEMPEPIGGIKAIQENVKYPEIAKRAGVQGRVYVKAFIDEEGNVVSTEVLKGIEAGLDQAAVKAIEAVRFTPGRQKGKAVKVQVSIPIMFKLN